jgi:succinate dehydrogenase / fumarate reductase, cytochrome b subunit
MTVAFSEENLMYKPREGHWSWLMHRISGLAIFLFLFGHILSTSTMVWGAQGPAIHARLDEIYRLPLFAFLHLLLFAAVLFHALNGIRIVIIDFWARSTGAQRPLFYAEMVLFAALMVGAIFWMVIPELQDYYGAREAAQAAQAQILVTPGGAH